MKNLRRRITIACGVALSVLTCVPAQAVEGGLQVDQERVSFTNLAPGHAQSGYVAMTNTSAQALFISAITLRTESMHDVSLTYTACRVPWNDGVCASESLTVADYDLTDLPTQVKTLDYVISAGHTTYFKLDARMGDAVTKRSDGASTQLVFKWTAQTDPPAGAHAIAMPGTLTIQGLEHGAPEPVTPPSVVAKVLASTGAHELVGAGVAVVLVVAGIVVVRSRRVHGGVKGNV